jgi:hypothetical protein
MNKALFVALGLAGALFVACGNADSTDSGGTGASGGSTGAGGSGQVCYDPNMQRSTSDGTSACEPTCTAGQHCTTGGVNCLNGCLTAANCASGQVCDMSANTTDLEQRPTGICRAPTQITCPTTNNGGSGGTSTTGGAGGTSTTGGAGGTTQAGVSCLLNAGPSAACGTYQQCVETKCDSQLQTALGATYKSGSIGGACKDFVSCVSAQGCSSSAEQTCVATATQDCKNAFGLVGTCIDQSCGAEQQACEGGTNGMGGMGQGGNGNGGAGGGIPDFMACTNLFTCCSQLDDQNEQQKCFATASGTDTEACTTRLSGYKAAGTCP